MGEKTRRYQVVSMGGNDVSEDSLFLIEAALAVAECWGPSVDRVRELTRTRYNPS
jgi:hypothetical protein